MDYLIFGLIVLALILGPVGIIALIVDLVKHKSKKNPLILLSISIICFVVSVSLLVTTGSGNTSPNGGSTPAYANNQSSNAMSDEEVFAAKFCMAYMNLLKNPYSFKVQSIWVYDGSSDSVYGNGYYAVYVKYTAENSYGADVADHIATMGCISDTELNMIASKDATYLSAFTTNDEFTERDLSDFSLLDANKIQNYINNNYN